jgi:hypothetical protein
MFVLYMARHDTLHTSHVPSGQCLYSTWPDTTHFTLHTLHQDEISSDHIRPRQTFVYILHTECKGLRTYTWNGSHLMSQYLQFYAYQFCAFQNFNIVIIPIRVIQYLDRRVGLISLCSKEFPEDGTPVPKRVAV